MTRGLATARNSSKYDYLGGVTGKLPPNSNIMDSIEDYDSRTGMMCITGYLMEKIT